MTRKHLLRKKKHLRVPVIGRERPAVTENDRLSASPIRVIDFDVLSVFFPVVVYGIRVLSRSESQKIQEGLRRLLRSLFENPVAGIRQDNDGHVVGDELHLLPKLSP